MTARPSALSSREDQRQNVADGMSAERSASGRSDRGPAPLRILVVDHCTGVSAFMFPVIMSRFSKTVASLRRVQQLLELLLEEAAELLAEPSDDESNQWLGIVVDKILNNLREQFEIEEQGEYMADVLERYPEWHPQVLHLQQEHELLVGQLRQISMRIRREHRAGLLSPECRRQLEDWIKWYHQHQHRETELVQEAFVLEVGQGE